MPRCVVAPLLLLIACQPSPPPAASSTSSSADSAAVAQLVRERLDAATTGDTARWHRNISDSALWTGPALRNVRTPEVIGVIAANRALKLAMSELAELEVIVIGDVALASYLQLVAGPEGRPRTGKRFRKTDVYQRRGDRWMMVGAAEIALPYRAIQPLSAARAAAIAGSYVIPGVDSLTLTPSDSGVQMRASDGSVTTLLVANDSTLFEEGDAGEWIVPIGRAPSPVLVYRMAGAADIVLRRTGGR